MKDAAIKLSKLVEEIEIKNPNIPVLHNVDANEKQNPDDIRNALIKQLSESVRWTDTILNMQRYGINTIIECGPGKVLTGLNKRICPDLKTFSLNDLTSLNALINDTI
jgi:[acyl-carrier-protein] S-malonyltransferase